MTLGQWPEALALIGLPWLLRRWGYRTTMAVGIGAWFVRFLSLSIGPPLWVAVGGTVLHGLGTALFVISGQVYIDSQSPPHRRAGAQALLVVLTSGLGVLLGSLLAGELTGRNPGRGVASAVFLVPCVIDAGLLIYFMRGFRAHLSTAERAGLPDVDVPPRPVLVRGTVSRVANLVAESADG
jgi:MFS family permease